MCFHDMTIRTNFHQNWSIMNVIEWFWHKSGLIGPWMTFEVILCFMKKVRLYNVDILEKF